MSRKELAARGAAPDGSFHWNSSWDSASSWTDSVSGKLGACDGTSTIQFADPSWFGTDAKMVAGLVHFACHGTTRELHWHARGDE